jgi:hypothetical protein
MNGGIEGPPPRRGAVRVVELAALVLPPGDVRRRYEREFVAELYGLDGGRQARYALGVLLTVWSLRAAVTSEDYEVLEASMGHVDLRRPLLCRLNLHHHWELGATDDGGRYTQCTLCGKIRDQQHPGLAGPPPPWSAP